MPSKNLSAHSSNLIVFGLVAVFLGYFFLHILEPVSAERLTTLSPCIKKGLAEQLAHGHRPLSYYDLRNARQDCDGDVSHTNAREETEDAATVAAQAAGLAPQTVTQ
jgi:hypothetical protein